MADQTNNFDRTNINDGFYQIRQAVTKISEPSEIILKGNTFPAMVLSVSDAFLHASALDYNLSYDLNNLNPTKKIKIYFRIDTPPLHSEIPLPDEFKNNTSPPSVSALKPAERSSLLISCHPHLIADHDEWQGLNPSDIIQIIFSDESYSSAQIVSIKKKSINNISLPGFYGGLVDPLLTLADMFLDAPQPEILGPEIIVSTPEEIKILAGFYDADDTIPRKDRYLPEVNKAHPEMLPYIKAYIYKAWTELGATIKVNSTYRSPRTQQRLIDDWVAGGKVGVEPAAAGTSWHNVGGALDHNPILKSGVTLGVGFPEKDREANRAMWKESGLVAIGESLGLNWGGHWEKPYDPIHFDLGRLFSKSQKNKLLAKSTAQGVEPTSIEFV